MAISSLLLMSLGLALAENPDNGAKLGGVSFAQAPQGAKSIAIPLAFTENPGGRGHGYLVKRYPGPASEIATLPGAIAEAYAGKDFSAYEIAKLPNGVRYLVVLHEDKSIRFLNRADSSMWYARCYRLGAGADPKPEILKEGFQSAGDVLFPVELEVPGGIGMTKVKRMETDIGYSLSSFDSSRPQVQLGRSVGFQVAGSHLLPEGKLTMTVTLPEEMIVTKNTQVWLQFEPFTPGLPERTAIGQLEDFLTLGAARFVVTGIAPDFSRATLALVSGSLEETLRQQMRVGAQIPAFSQVDLLTHKAVTREDVLAKAKPGKPVVFVFGDLPVSRGHYPTGLPSGATPTLPLPPSEIADQLGLELNPKPIVLFVTRQVGIDFLYGDLRNKAPGYILLADFADPLKTIFRVPQGGPGPYYGPMFQGSTEPSLRQLFNLTDRTLALVACDSKGKVIYVKADAGSALLPALAEVRTACKRR